MEGYDDVDEVCELSAFRKKYRKSGENPAQDRYCIADGNSHTAKPDTFADNQQCSSSSGGMLLWLYLYLGMPFFVLRKNIAIFAVTFTGKTDPDKTKGYKIRKTIKRLQE